MVHAKEADSKWSWSQDGEAFLIKSLMVYLLTLKLSALCLEEILISMSNNGLNSLSLPILERYHCFIKRVSTIRRSLSDKPPDGSFPFLLKRIHDVLPILKSEK